jgi:hypothetical protein
VQRRKAANRVLSARSSEPGKRKGGRDNARYGGDPTRTWL